MSTKLQAFPRAAPIFFSMEILGPLGESFDNGSRLVEELDPRDAVLFIHVAQMMGRRKKLERTIDQLVEATGMTKSRVRAAAFALTYHEGHLKRKGDTEWRMTDSGRKILPRRPSVHSITFYPAFFRHFASPRAAILLSAIWRAVEREYGEAPPEELVLVDQQTTMLQWTGLDEHQVDYALRILRKDKVLKPLGAVQRLLDVARVTELFREGE